MRPDGSRLTAQSLHLQPRRHAGDPLPLPPTLGQTAPFLRPVSLHYDSFCCRDAK
jgi:hypothetical protein